jgi:hypothetical protein
MSNLFNAIAFFIFLWLVVEAFGRFHLSLFETKYYEDEDIRKLKGE